MMEKQQQAYIAASAENLTEFLQHVDFFYARSKHFIIEKLCMKKRDHYRRTTGYAFGKHLILT